MPRERALVGFTGFVGSNLAEQAAFDSLYNSSNIHEMRGRSYSLVVCAGVSALKWKANQDPQADWRGIQALLDVMATVSADRMVLVSTIDVYPVRAGVDESYDCASLDNHAYGAHRLAVETFFRERFPSALIVRLPALFGPGLKKNAIFDLLNGHGLDAVNPGSSFQFYDLLDLWSDVGKAEAAGLSLINLFTEPIRMRTILDEFFPNAVVGAGSPRQDYDLETLHSGLRGRSGPYLYGREEIMEKLASFIARQRGGR
jgi:hypothetical protein